MSDTLLQRINRVLSLKVTLPTYNNTISTINDACRFDFGLNNVHYISSSNMVSLFLKRCSILFGLSCNHIDFYTLTYCVERKGNMRSNG